MANTLHVMEARIAGQLANDAFRSRFAPQTTYQTTPVAGNGLVRVGGQLAPSVTGPDEMGSVMGMTNIGRPAMALYAPQGALIIQGAPTSKTITAALATAPIIAARAVHAHLWSEINDAPDTLTSATQIGQVLFSLDGSEFTAALPLIGKSGAWLSDGSGLLLVTTG